MVIVRPPLQPTGQPRRMLTLDIHDEIVSREWVTIDEAGHAVMDAGEAHAAALGEAFETWLAGQSFHSDQLRVLHLVKEQVKANANELIQFESWRFDQPPLSMNGGYERARSVFGGDEELETALRAMNDAVFGDHDPDGEARDSAAPVN